MNRLERRRFTVVALASPADPSTTGADLFPLGGAEAGGVPYEPTVLVVSEDVDLRGFLCVLLRVMDCVVAEASSTSTAIDVVQRYPSSIRLVITEMTLRSMTGVQLVHKLRSLGASFHTVMLTRTSKKPKPIPGVVILTIPLDAEKVAATVRSLLHGGQT